MQKRFKNLRRFVRTNAMARSQLLYFDWLLFFIMLGISLFGVVCIFSATTVPVDQEISSIMQLVSVQPTEYARLQITWILVGLAFLAGMAYLDYKWLSQFSNTLYWANVIVLVVVLFMERGRGNMAGWFRWGADQMRTLQPSEFGKLALIVALAKLFANRKRPIKTLMELMPVLAYVGLPLILIAAQPDLGTALVYIAIFGVMLFVSGTDYKIIFGIIIVAIALLVPLWYYVNNTDSFRSERIMVYLDPSYDPLGAGLQMTNARTAIGSGGLWGKGIYSAGSFASLKYIPDAHTDFIFAIVCESFGFVGTGILVAAMLAMLLRLTAVALRTEEAFGRYFIIGYTAMLFFHMFENIGMILGIVPVTGIPLPFVSYGGSNLLTNMIGYGIVLNIAMHNWEHTRRRVPRPTLAL
jgi:rod shape determining protein RodA